MDDLKVINNTDHNRFEADLGNDFAFIEYSEGEDYLSLDHTFVPDSHRGKGIAGRLIHQVLEYIRERKIQIIARCPVVRKYIETHPEYIPLLKLQG
jgi:uncharacterized protein